MRLYALGTAVLVGGAGKPGSIAPCKMRYRMVTCNHSVAYSREAAVGTHLGALVVRRSIWIDAKPERVWQEFETFEAMRGWFGTGHTLVSYEPRVGGWVETDPSAVQGEPLRFAGRVTVFDPPRELTFEQDWIGHGWAAPSLITFRLTPALGGTLVELLHHGFDRLGPGSAEDHRGFENGWGMMQLEALLGRVRP